MRSRVYFGALVATAFAMTGVLGTSATGAGAEVAVRVQKEALSVAGNVDISFRPTTPLPPGGYYYGVIVLKPYRHHTHTIPPPCAVSSDMQKTAYGYAHPGQAVRLALTRAPSRLHRWCRDGVYTGAIYAVPNPPPCESRYPCSSEYSEASPCFEIGPGQRACGVVARTPAYAYPAGLPAPLEKGTHIIGYFRVTF